MGIDAREVDTRSRIFAWRRDGEHDSRCSLPSSERVERASAFPFPGCRSYGNDKRDVASNGRWPATYLRDVHTPSMLTESSPRHSRGAHVHTQRCRTGARTVIRAYSSHLTCVHCESTRSVHISLLYGVFSRFTRSLMNSHIILARWNFYVIFLCVNFHFHHDSFNNRNSFRYCI